MRKIAIIGGGPAGLSAAIYAARANLNPIVFAPSGGQLELAFEIGNFPGFPELIQGSELMSKMTAQAEKYGTEIIKNIISKVDFTSRPFKLWTDTEQLYEAESVIIATGASARWLGVPGEAEFRGRGVSACATCDGFFFKDKDVIVVGGGDTALEEALFLVKFVNKVYVVHRRKELRASTFMQDRAFKNDKIEFIWNSEVREILGREKLESVKLFNNKTNEESEMKIDGVFVTIGHLPNTKFLTGQVGLDEEGYVIKKNLTHTSVDGVFVAGDAADRRYRQASVAAGFGVMAEIDAERWLDGEKKNNVKVK